MNTFYSSSSDTDRGTLSNLQYVINRKNITASAVKNVKNEYHAVSDFIDVVTDAYIIALFMTHMNIEKSDETAAAGFIPTEIIHGSTDDKAQYFHNLIANIVDTHILNKFSASLNRITDGESQHEKTTDDCSRDGVYQYSTNFLKFALLRRINNMSTRAGDGNRVMRHWRFALLIFFANHHTNYQLESFLLTASVKALLSPRLSHSIVWNRFVYDFLTTLN